MTANERRQEIIEVLNLRRQDTMKNLAQEFGVTDRTIRNDITVLSLTHPIETIRGKNGGVRLMDGFSLNRKYLKPNQKELLIRLACDLQDEDLAIMDSILQDFAFNPLEGG